MAADITEQLIPLGNVDLILSVQVVQIHLPQREMFTVKAVTLYTPPPVMDQLLLLQLQLELLQELSLSLSSS